MNPESTKVDDLGEWPFTHIGPSKTLGDTLLRTQERIRTLQSIEHRHKWTFQSLQDDYKHKPSECVLCAAYAEILRSVGLGPKK